MADKKISALTALIQANVDTTNDVLPIVDTNATETKKVTPAALVGAAAAAGLTNVDINSGTIDGVTIATSDITVGATKTLDVSAGTLTLANDQISGDSVEGGTINAITINTLGGTTANVTTVNATTVDATNVEVTNVKAKDGTAAITIADSTGAVTVGAGATINGGAVFNESGADVDFRIESDTNANAFVLDGATGNIAIGTTSPSAPLDIYRSDITAYNGSATDGQLSAGSTLFVRQVGANNNALAQIVFQPRVSQPYNRIVSSGGSAPFMAFATNNEERLRIDSSGNVGIGGTALAYTKVDVTGTLPTASNVSYANYVRGTFPSGATGTAIGFYSNPTTEAASFTISNLAHFFARPQALGAGSAVTNQYGYFAHADLTAATNNYGFYSNIASGSGRYNFFANGSADNYFAGNVGIGTTSPGYKLDVVGTGKVSSDFQINTGRTISGGSGGALISSTGINTDFVSTGRAAAITGTWGTVRIHQVAGHAGLRLIGDTSQTAAYMDVENSSGSILYRIDSSGNVGIGLTPVAKLDVYNSAAAAANNEVLRLRYNTAVTAGTSGDLNFANSAGTALGRISSIIEDGNNVGLGFSTFNSSLSQKVLISANGNVGIGGTAGADTKLNITGTLPSSGTVSRTLFTNVTVPSGTTAEANGFQTSIATQAASFTLGSLYHFHAVQGAIGAGSAVTSQYGFAVNSGLTGATNNYGFYSNIASAANRWNLYCAGTAENYVANNLKIGGTAARATTAGTNQLVLFNGTAPVGTLANGVSFYSASGEANVMDAAGNATLLSPHDSETNEWIFRSKHTPTGKVLRIDVEKMLRFINEHFDLDMVQEWTE